MIQDVEITVEYLQSLLEWSQPQVIRKRYRFVAEPNADFEWLWHHRRTELVALGVDGGDSSDSDRQVVWWREVPQAVNLELQRAVVASASTSSNIHVPLPEGLKLRDYQLAGVAFFRGKKRLLIGDDPGVGKSPLAIGIINDNPEWKSALIICPAYLKINWQRELKRWLAREMSSWIADPKLFPKRDIVIINFELLPRFMPQISSRTWDVCILDEAHLIKNRKTIAYKNLMAIQRYTRNRIAMTGTPVVNEAHDVFPLVSWLDPVKYDNPVRFEHYYGDERRLQLELRSDIMLRRRKRDVLKELPPRVNRIIEFDLPDPSLIRSERAALGDAKIARLDQMERAVSEAKLLKDERAYRRAMEELTEELHVRFDEMSALRHKTALAMLPQALQYLELAIEESGKVITFAHHRDILEAAHRHVKGSVLHYGGMDPAMKQLSVDRFQNDPKVPAFFGSLKGSVLGVTLTASFHVVFFEQDWNPPTMDQASSRADRFGQTESVLCDHLIPRGSLYARMAKRQMEKWEISDRVLDDQVSDSTLK